MEKVDLWEEYHKAKQIVAGTCKLLVMSSSRGRVKVHTTDLLHHDDILLQFPMAMLLFAVYIDYIKLGIPTSNGVLYLVCIVEMFLRMRTSFY